MRSTIVTGTPSLSAIGLEKCCWRVRIWLSQMREEEEEQEEDEEEEFVLRILSPASPEGRGQAGHAEKEDS